MMARMAASVRSISLLIPPGDSLVRYGWLKVWLPIACPASTICLAMAGLDVALDPVMKNVACTFFSLRMASSCGVVLASGPSS